MFGGRRTALAAHDVVLVREGVPPEEGKPTEELTHAAPAFAGIHKMHTDRGGGPGEVRLANEVVEDLLGEHALGEGEEIGFGVDRQDDDPGLAGLGVGVTP